MKIKDLPKSDRPREKLIAKEAESDFTSDHVLGAIFTNLSILAGNLRRTFRFGLPVLLFQAQALRQ